MKIKHLMMKSKFFTALIGSNVVLIGATIGFTWGFLTGMLTLIGSHGGGINSNNYRLDIISVCIFLPSLIVSSITPNKSVMFIGSPLIGALIAVAVALLVDKSITSIINKYKGG